ncbi:MAG: 2OG-Fe(II) oxygenase [Candidatus Nitrotoga sp.]|nr:2OG-Fe(II) oxygenase [Candidatus Nitrotoga sp.]MDO9448158.1 2OG-Fe(II) oxygenase [Candidatus Nitrotoga sp.]MDP3496818.1 2OG-Fe(II) oxygenase [Candidatus Nitrotoga sp.]
MNTPRDIQLKIHLAGGHEHTVTLREDAPELLVLFTALSTPESGNRFVQLPLDGGKVACSFQTSQLVSIVSEPPVVMELHKVPELGKVHNAEHPTSATQLRRPRFVVIDDFLSPQEHNELLAFSLISEEQFKAGTITSYDPETRQNLAILGFGESVHSRLVQNRLLIWFPLLAKTFGMPVFPLAMVESQLTAAGDGHYFKVHCDDAPDLPRVLSCVYYLHREPRGFAGGDLRLYDCIETGGSRRPADTFTTVEPVANRLVVFPSEEFHEAMPVRCPSKEFADSRFAVTTWLHRAACPDPGTVFGWGHFRCGVVAPQFAAYQGSGGNKS